MSSLRVAYCRGKNIASPFIRVRFPGDWTHCGVVTPEGLVVEATFWKGVVATPLDQVIARSSHLVVAEIDCPSPTSGIDWAIDQLGKKYDLAGALGLGVRRDWQSPEKWFCSELVEMALVKAGRRRFRSDVWRIDPQLSWSVL